MDNDNQLLHIGLFSRLTAISVRMLRHYQERRVLEPARIDPFTGHRYYSPTQLTDAHWIVRLRDAGLGINEIAQVMANREDPERLRLILSAHGERLESDFARLESRRHVFQQINTYLQESTMDIDVRQIHMPEMIVASLRRVLASYGDEGVLWQEIGPLMAASGVGMPDHGEGIGVSGIRCRCRSRSMAPGSVLVHARRSPRVPHHSPVRGRSRNTAGQLRERARSHRRSGHPHRGE